MTLRFVFGAKLTIFGATYGVARVKIYTGDKILEKKFLRICFLLGDPFWSHFRSNLVSLAVKILTDEYMRENLCSI